MAILLSAVQRCDARSLAIGEFSRLGTSEILYSAAGEYRSVNQRMGWLQRTFSAFRWRVEGVIASFVLCPT